MPVRARGVQIPDAELEWRFTRSGGPGGQHANTSDTAVELRWDVAASAALSNPQRQRIQRRLGHRLTDAGVLVLRSAEHRSQTRNREAALARLAALLDGALAPPPERRKPTRPSRAARQRRREAKRRQAEKKALRRRPDAP